MSLLRASIRATALRSQARTLSTTRPVLAGSDYGGAHAPEGQRPSDQAGKKNPSEHLEHPGPKSPAEGSNSSGSSESSASGGSKASPKIHQDSQSVNDVHPDENVRKHNEEAAKRHDRSTNDKDEKVHKGYWSTERASE